MDTLRDRIMAGDPAAIAEVGAACRRYRGDALDGAVGSDDLAAEAVAAIIAGDAATAGDAARVAYNATRRARVGGDNVGMSYMSAVVAEDADGGVLTLGDTLADTLADGGEAGRDPFDTLAALADMVAAKRAREILAAHGRAAHVAGGLPNAARGAANDADILRALEAVGGRSYGYAGRIVAYLAGEGRATNANAVRVAVHRALGRTEGGKHSSRD